MQHIVWLFEEAWDHRRRRYRQFALAALATVAIAALVWVAIPHGSGSRTGSASPQPPRPDVVPASRVLSKSPYLGVSCPMANSITCDRVGLAVWLKRPAVSVTATIAGAPLALSSYGDSHVNATFPRRQFTGFLKPAGIVSRLHIRPVDGNETITQHGRTRVIVGHQMWFGEGNARSPLIKLTVRYPDGQTIITQRRVGLAAGWG
jgi:hypothetical protein